MFNTPRLVLALAGLLSFVVIASPASADGGNVQVTNFAFANSSFDTSVTASAFDVDTVTGAAKLNGKLEVRAIMRHGLPKSKQHGGFWGEASWSQWSISTGGDVWSPPGHHGWTHMVRDKSSSTGFRQIGGCTRHNGKHVCSWNCGNPVVPMGHRPPRHIVKVKLSQIVVVKHFTFVVHVTSQANAQLLGTAQASCTTANSSASATVGAWGTASATATATARARSKTTAIAIASGRASRMLNNAKERDSLFATATTNAQVGISGKATVWCQSSPNTPPPPPEKPQITITSIIQLNDVPEGKTSGPMPVSVNASAAGGSLTVDPGIGGVSDCNSNTSLPGALVFNNLPAGNIQECVIYYAPKDASATQDTITYTANLGTATSVKTTLPFAITHPIRPGADQAPDAFAGQL
jgi:hypothetical protein